MAAGWLTLAAVGFLMAGAPDRADPFSAVRERIVRLIAEKTIPSLSLAVVEDGAIVWEEAFGLADLEKKVAATTGTLYPVASVTKPFTATAVMILAERGLVDLDRPANAYLEGAKLRAREGDASGATVGRILRHTAGLPMFWSFYYEGSPRRRPPLETTLKRYGILVSGPGNVYDYSNLGYAVLESIIERVSGKPYAEFLAAEVFGPLGMSGTAVITEPPGRPGVAVKYGPALAPVPFCDHDTRGASAVHSTAHDLALFLLLHLGRLGPGQKAILAPASVVAMRASRDPDVRSSSYALGWETGTRHGYPIVTHGGIMDGCRAHLAMIPSEGLGVAVLINGENVPSIQVCDGIFAALLPDYARRLGGAPAGGLPPPPPSVFAPPAALIGAWEGAVVTHEGEISVRLVVGADGRAELTRMGPDGAPGAALSPLKTPTADRGVFVVHFPQAFATSDAPGPGQRTVLRLRAGPDGLRGEALTIAADGSYALPSFVKLERAAPRPKS